MRTVTDAEIQRGCCDEPDVLYEVGVYVDGQAVLIYSGYDADVCHSEYEYLRRGYDENRMDSSVHGVWMRP